MRQERVSFSFHCFFDLQLYPFGMHRCNFNLSIAGNDDMAPRFQENVITINIYQVYDSVSFPTKCDFTYMNCRTSYNFLCHSILKLYATFLLL